MRCCCFSFHLLPCCCCCCCHGNPYHSRPCYCCSPMSFCYQLLLLQLDLNPKPWCHSLLAPLVHSAAAVVATVCPSAIIHSCCSWTLNRKPPSLLLLPLLLLLPPMSFCYHPLQHLPTPAPVLLPGGITVTRNHQVMGLEIIPDTREQVNTAAS